MRISPPPEPTTSLVQRKSPRRESRLALYSDMAPATSSDSGMSLLLPFFDSLTVSMPRPSSKSASSSAVTSHVRSHHDLMRPIVNSMARVRIGSCW